MCPVCSSSRLLAKKWLIMIIEEISLGKFDGFNSFLKKASPITPRSLSIHLKKMEQAGLIVKNSDNGRSVYELTTQGRHMQKIIAEIKKYNVRWGNVPEECLTTPCSRCTIFKQQRSRIHDDGVS